MKKVLLFCFLSIAVFFPAVSYCQLASHVVISEVYGGGGNSGAMYKNDFIELYNTTNVTVSLAGWSVQYAAATSSFSGTTSASNTTPLTGSIAPYSFYLIQEAVGAGGTTNLPAVDASGTIALAATAGKVALVSNTSPINASTTAVIDFVGFGTTANAFEGAGPTPAPSNSTSIERKAYFSSTQTSLAIGGTDAGKGNGFDSDNNNVDFIVPSTVNPQNSSSAIENPFTIYYSKSTGDLSTLSTWGTNPDGSGNNPSSFLVYTNLFNIDNRSSADVVSPWTVQGQINIATIVTSLNLNGNLTIKSDANGTGRIGPIPSTTTVSGIATVERYISSLGNRAYRLLAPSVNSVLSIHNNWQEGVTSNTDNPSPGFGTHITGTMQDQNNGFDGTTSGQPSLFLYNPLPTPQTWEAINNTATNTLNAKTGYLLFVRGDRSVSLTSTSNPLPSTNTILRAKGTLLTGDQTFTGLQGSSRFSLVTNPYASPINWSTIYNDNTTTNSTNFVSSYTYWDPNVNSRGGYVTVNTSGVKSIITPPGNGASSATVEIQSGQAFFIQAQAGASSPTFTVKESHKTQGNNIDVFRVGDATNSPSFRAILLLDVDGTKKIADGAVVIYNNDFSAAVDGNDAEELANFDENIAIAREGKMLSIEGRPLIDGSDNIPLSIARLKQQQYEWQFDPSNFSAQNLQANLQDKFLNTLTPISLATVTVVPFSVTANAASAAADRFTIVFAQTVALPITVTSVKASQKLTGIQVEWNVLNEINIDKYEIQKSSDGMNFIPATIVAATGGNTSAKTYSWFDANPNIDNNYYRIRSVSKTGAVVYSEVVRINLGKVAMALSIYPNPVQGDVIGLQLSNFEKGRYTINLTNQLGQQVYSKVIDHAGGAASETLQVGAFVKGVYQLQLKGEHATITQQIIKQ